MTLATGGNCVGGNTTITIKNIKNNSVQTIKIKQLAKYNEFTDYRIYTPTG